MNKLISKKFLALIITAICNMAIVFGLKISPEEKKNAMIAVNGILAIYLAVQGAVDRQTERRTLTDDEIKEIVKKVEKDIRK